MTNRDEARGKKTAPSRPTKEAVREPREKTPSRPTKEAVRDPRQDDSPPGERIAKRMARAGLCSRREAEAWIGAGRVAVDGQTLDSPACVVTAASRIEIDGKPIPRAEAPRLWRYHKPRGLLTTNRDIRGRPIIFDHLPADLPRVVTVGRLDMNSEGLLLLTNDGEIARRLELPSTGWVRRYRVRVKGTVDVARLESLTKGIEIEGVRYGPVRASLDRQLDTNAWLTIGLNEGKNREVRRICEHLGWPVMRLIRTAYGPFQLGNLPEGAVAEAPASVLRDQLGAEQAGGRVRAAQKTAEQAGGRVRAAKKNDGKVQGGKKTRTPKRKSPPLVGGGRGRGESAAGGEKDSSPQPARTPKSRPAARPRSAAPPCSAHGGGGKGTQTAKKKPSSSDPSRRASGPPQDEGGRVEKARKKPGSPHPEEARSAVSKDRQERRKPRKPAKPDAHHRR